MPQILHEVQARHPGLVINQVEASVPEQYQQLIDGRLDVGIGRAKDVVGYQCRSTVLTLLCLLCFTVGLQCRTAGAGPSRRRPADASAPTGWPVKGSPDEYRQEDRAQGRSN